MKNYSHIFLILLTLQAITPLQANGLYILEGFAHVLAHMDEKETQDILKDKYFKVNGSQDVPQKWQVRFNEVLQKCGISENVPVKLAIDPDHAVAAVRHVPGQGNVLWINEMDMDKVEAIGPERVNAVLYHEAAHVQANHNIQNKILSSCATVGTALSALITFAITKGIKKKALVPSMLASSAAFVVMKVGSNTAKKRLVQLQEMEADLIAVKNAYKKDILDIGCGDDSNFDDGAHPSFNEQLHYFDQFEKELYEGRDPSPKKHALSYLAERRLLKAIWQKKID